MSYHGERISESLQVVYLDTASPLTATVFSATADPLVHDPLLAQDNDNAYIGIDGTMWQWNGTTYVARQITPTTPFYVGGTATDAGADKTGNIFHQGLVGFSETANFAPKTFADIETSLGVTHREDSGAAVSVLSTDVAVHLIAASAQTVTLPTAASSLRRVLFFSNPTGFAKTISSYNDLFSRATTTIPANTHIVLQSTGSVWQLVDKAEPEVTHTNAQSVYVKKTTTDSTIVNWVSPWTKVPLTELDITVPAGSTLFAEYALRGQTANGAYTPFAFKLRGLNAGDRYTASRFVTNTTMAAGTTGNNTSSQWFNEARPDNDPFFRGTNIDMAANVVVPCTMHINYENLSASPSTIGLDWGCDGHSAINGVNLKILAGSLVRYAIFPA